MNGRQHNSGSTSDWTSCIWASYCNADCLPDTDTAHTPAVCLTTEADIRLICTTSGDVLSPEMSMFAGRWLSAAGSDM